MVLRFPKTSLRHHRRPLRFHRTSLRFCRTALHFDKIAFFRVWNAAQGAPDFATFAPVLKAMVQGNKVDIDWDWQGFRKFLQQCEIQVDRGNGWEILTFDTTPDYTDSHPHPAAATQWKYRAIYRVDDTQVGQWSPVVSVMVGG